MIRAWARRALDVTVAAPAVGLLARLGVAPNAVTVGGLAVTVGAAYVAATGSLLWAGILLIVAGLFDLLDGALARATGRVSAFGALLDSTVDRLAEAALLLGLLVRFVLEGSLAGVVLTYLSLTFSFLVSYLRARAEGLDVECRVGLMTRPERVALLALGMMVGWWYPLALIASLGLVAALALVTVFQRLLHVRRQVRR